MSSDSSSLPANEREELLDQQEENIKAIFNPGEVPKLVVSVFDSGIGLTIKEQSRLFKLFGTINRAKSVNTRGVGLGLSISKMIAEHFGGSVAV